MALTSLAFSLLAFSALALAMDRHYGQVLQGRPNPTFRRVLRLGGSALIVVAAIACVAAYGWSIGLTWWLGILTAAAMTILVVLTYRPATLLRLSMACPLIAVVPLLFQF